MVLPSNWKVTQTSNSTPRQNRKTKECCHTQKLLTCCTSFLGVIWLCIIRVRVGLPFKKNMSKKFNRILCVRRMLHFVYSLLSTVYLLAVTLRGGLPLLACLLAASHVLASTIMFDIYSTQHDRVLTFCTRSARPV